MGLIPAYSDISCRTTTAMVASNGQEELDCSTHRWTLCRRQDDSIRTRGTVVRGPVDDDERPAAGVPTSRCSLAGGNGGIVLRYRPKLLASTAPGALRRIDCRRRGTVGSPRSHHRKPCGPVCTNSDRGRRDITITPVQDANGRAGRSDTHGFLVEPKETEIQVNMLARARAVADRTEDQLRNEARAKWLFGQWLTQEAAKHSLPIVHPRPWDTLAERITDHLG